MKTKLTFLLAILMLLSVISCNSKDVAETTKSPFAGTYFTDEDGMLLVFTETELTLKEDGIPMIVYSYTVNEEINELTLTAEKTTYFDEEHLVSIKEMAMSYGLTVEQIYKEDFLFALYHELGTIKYSADFQSLTLFAESEDDSVELTRVEL